MTTPMLSGIHGTDRGDDGSGLILALLTTVLLASMGVALMVVGDTERAIASTYRVGGETLYAADAAAERALQDLTVVDHWADFLSGAARSSFTDATLTPVTSWGAHLDLNALTAARQAASDALAGTGPNRPRWRLFAYGPLAALLDDGGLAASPYLVVWIADDPSETDNDPAADANGQIVLTAEAFGAGGADRSVEVAVARASGEADDESGSGERGRDALNQQASAMAVDVPGQHLDGMRLDVAIGGMVAP